MIRPDLSLLHAYVPGATIPGTLKLASNECSLPPLPSVLNAVADAATGVNRYPDMGAIALRERIAEWFSSTQEQTQLTIDNVAVGNGSTALCLQTIQATCSAGDELLFAWRSFEAYPILARVVGATPVQVPLTADLSHDLPAMAAAITEKTRLIMVCNPNNPTGTTISAQAFDEFMAAVPSTVHVILDEAYLEYNTELWNAAHSSPEDSEQDAAENSPQAADILARYPNVAVLRTMSKAYGLAGLRLGYLLGQSDFIEAVNKVAVPFGVNAVAQAAALACLEPQAQQELLARVSETVEQRGRVLDFLTQDYAQVSGTVAGSDSVNSAESSASAESGASAGSSAFVGVPPISSQSNFVWLNAGEHALALDAALKKHGVVGRCFPGEGVRVTCTTREETDVLLSALSAAFADLRATS